MTVVPASFPTSTWDGLSGNNWRETRNDYINPDGEDWDRIVAEVIAMQEVIGGVGSAGSSPSSAVSESELGNPVRKTVLTLDDLSIATTDADTNGAHGSAIIYTFPNGAIHILGATTDLTVARVGTSIEADAAIVMAVGSAATGVDNATLTSTEANIVPSTAATLTTGAGTMKGESTATATLDGTSSAANARLNVAVPGDDHGASADAVLVSGTVTIVWVHLGDN